MGVVLLLEYVVRKLRSSTDASGSSLLRVKTLVPLERAAAAFTSLSSWRRCLGVLLTLVVLRACGDHVGRLCGLGGESRGGGPGRWLCAEAAASGGVKALALRRRGVESESRGWLARRPVFSFHFFFCSPPDVISSGAASMYGCVRVFPLLIYRKPSIAGSFKKKK